MYDVHLGLTGKRVVDFLLVLIQLFSLGVTADKSAFFNNGVIYADLKVDGTTPCSSDQLNS